MLFDWLVTGQVLPSNPAHAVPGARHTVREVRPRDPVGEARALLDSMEASNLVRLRDRAVIAVMA